ncbi:hypothetical protein ACQBAR_07310 [Propionibacteriaceae bacterium Y1685]
MVSLLALLMTNWPGLVSAHAAKTCQWKKVTQTYTSIGRDGKATVKTKTVMVPYNCKEVDGGGDGDEAPTSEDDSGPSAEESAAALREAIAKYNALEKRHVECMGSSIVDPVTKMRVNAAGDPVNCGRLGLRPEPPKGLPKEYLNAIISERTPEEIAYSAAAQLALPEPVINIGPDPSWNRWNKAFVGYDYWIWVGGGTSVGPVSSQSGPATVSLRAEVTELSVSVDGATLSCTGPGTPYVRDRDVGRVSPDCGHVFETTGEKRLVAVAQWTVSWSTGGESGSFEFQRRGQMDTVVGELHAVNVDPPG